VKVSDRDSRYFEFSNGQPFVGLGHAVDFTSIIDAKQKLATLRDNGATFARAWMSASTILGRGYLDQQWDPWAKDWPTIDQVAPGSDFSVRLDRGNTCTWYWQGDAQPALEANTSYRVRVKAKLVNVTGPATAGKVWGLTVAFRNWWDSMCNPANTVLYLTQDGSGNPIGDTGTQDWHWFEGRFTSPNVRVVNGRMGHLVVSLENTTGGEAYLDEVYIGEDLGAGRIGPNIISKGRFNYQDYFDQGQSFFWDKVLDEAAADQVYLKLVMLEKNDSIFNLIKFDGTYDPNAFDYQYNQYFHAWPGTRVRRIHEYYWRYVVARWGYSTAVHSWELINEGAGSCPPNIHMEQAQAMTDFMRANDPNQHLTTTSFWAGNQECYYGRNSTLSPD